jgi:hypothetical protein
MSKGLGLINYSRCFRFRACERPFFWPVQTRRFGAFSCSIPNDKRKAGDEDFMLPRWVVPENSIEDPIFQRQEENDPKNILRRFENPERRSIRARVFGTGYSLKTMTGEDAWRNFGLSPSDLARLPSMNRLGVVHDSSSVTRLYNKV